MIAKGAFICLLIGFLAGCGGGGGAGDGSLSGSGPEGANVLAVSVGGMTPCSGNGSSPDSPCVSVTFCSPGTAACQTIPDILVDTGSVGLRIFKSAITNASVHFSNTQSPLPATDLAECAIFNGGMATWGPVMNAGVDLGGEPQVVVPVQVIDATFNESALSATDCDPASVTLVSSPGNAVLSVTTNGETYTTSGFTANGILGVDLFQIDPGIYYTCATNNTGCSLYSANQGIPPDPIVNPVYSLPTDNNGISLIFPSVSATGAPSLSGSLVLGIGTRSNNGAPAAVHRYPVDPSYGYMTTTYTETGSTVPVQYQAYIDSGTNGFGLPDSAIPTCRDGFYCPNSTLSLQAENLASGNVPELVNFSLANADNVFNTGNTVFNNIGFPAGSPGIYIWGFPYFLGRTIYFGYDGQVVSSLGVGPFYAY